LLKFKLNFTISIVFFLYQPRYDYGEE
jgi:hypothetical protein